MAAAQRSKNGSYLPPFQPRVCECARVSVCVNVCGIRASFIQTIPSNTTHVSPISSPLTPFVGQHTWLSLFMSQIWANAYAMPRLDGLALLGWKPPTCHPLATPQLPTYHHRKPTNPLYYSSPGCFCHFACIAACLAYLTNFRKNNVTLHAELARYCFPPSKLLLLLLWLRLYAHCEKGVAGGA